MEAHHPHIHEKKKLTEYVFEFVMLFLAVFLGFIAENIRETMSGHEREKQYAFSLIRDLAADTVSINTVVDETASIKKSDDSLLQLLKSPAALQNANRLYYYFIPTNYYSAFTAITKTFQQLENAGEMRLFRDPLTADSITSYYEHAKGVQGQFDTYLRYFDLYHEEAFHLFSYIQIDTIFNDPQQLLTTTKKLKLKTTDAGVIDNVFGKLYIVSTIGGIYKNDLLKLKKRAIHTIEYLQSKYK